MLTSYLPPPSGDASTCRTRGRGLSQVKALLILDHVSSRMPVANHSKTVVTLPQPASAPERRLDAAIVAEMPKLRTHAFSLLYDQADANDLIQDCLETALTKQTMLQDPARLRPWLYAILNNLFLMRLRRGARRGTPLPIDEFSDNLAASAAPQDRAVAMDLGRAMGRLSMEHRQILLLINLDGYSYQDVAEILHVPIGTVMSRLARARQRLRALLDGHDLREVGT